MITGYHIHRESISVAKKYRVGVIGHTGKGGYGHGLDRVCAEVPQLEVVAIADPDKSGRAAAVDRTGAKRGYADYRKMLDREDLDIGIVATGHVADHRDMAVACAEHGIHIYIEKPFVQDLQQADDVVTALEMRHLKLAMAHINRYSPVCMMCNKLVEQGEIGAVLELRARGKDDRRGGGQDLWVLGTHVLDMMRMFAGDVHWSFGRVQQHGRPVTQSDVYQHDGLGPLVGDTVAAMFSFQGSNLTGYFASRRAMAGSPTRFGLRIYGSKGIIQLQSSFLRPAHILKDSSWSPGRTGSQWIPISSAGIGKPEPRTDIKSYGNKEALLDLIDAIENDRQPIGSVYDARASVEMIASVFESHRLGRPVSFPLENRRNPLTMLEG